MKEGIRGKGKYMRGKKATMQIYLQWMWEFDDPNTALLPTHFCLERICWIRDKSFPFKLAQSRGRVPLLKTRVVNWRSFDFRYCLKVSNVRNIIILLILTTKSGISSEISHTTCMLKATYCR